MIQYNKNPNICNHINYCKIPIILFLILIPITTIINFEVMLNTYANSQFIFSLADFLLNTGSSVIFYINFVIIPCFIISSLTRFDFYINNITRYSKKKIVYLWQYKTIIITVLLVSVYQFLISTFLGYMLTDININFSQNNSIFCFINQGRTSDISLLYVYIVTYLFCFLSSLLFCSLHLAIKWLIGNEIVNYLFFIFCFLLDMCGKGICALWGVDYEKWLPYNILNLIIILLLAVIIFFIGQIIADRKEFLNAK